MPQNESSRPWAGFPAFGPVHDAGPRRLRWILAEVVQCGHAEGRQAGESVPDEAG